MTVVELILWSGCPSTEEARELLNRALSEAGLPSQKITERYIEDYQIAQEEKFIGSPTFRVNGEDVIQSGEHQAYGLTCRVYQKADGRFSPLPEYAAVVAGVKRLSA